MWKKLTTKEIEAQSQQDLINRWRNFKEIAGLSAFLTAIIIAIDWLPSGGRWLADGSNYGVKGMLQRSPWFLLIFTSIFLVLAIIRACFPHRWFNPRGDLSLCSNCQELFPKYNKTCPNCKKELENPRKYKWIEDKKNPTNECTLFPAAVASRKV